MKQLINQVFSSQIIKAVKVLWDFNQLNQDLSVADLILILGSSDLNVAIRGAQIYHLGLGKTIITSGGFGRLTSKFTKSEADRFKDILVENKVPKDIIFVEDKSTNTGENIRFSQNLILDKPIKANSIILVTKTYMEKRALATFQKQWLKTETKVQITSPKTSFETFLHSQDIQNFINIIVGDTQRLKLYPELGFMEKVDIPDYVWNAYNYLVGCGFDSQIVT